MPNTNKNTQSKKSVARKSQVKKAASKKPIVIKAVPDKNAKMIINKAVKKKVLKELPASGKPVDNVKIRMYCLGTGDCFVLKFCHKQSVEFTMLLDCGSCMGGPDEFKPYIEHLAAYVNKKVDLLVVTHEHNDHVNGFSKCEDIFKGFTIGQAWFAWTENPEDPTGAAADLQKKRSKMKLALHNAIHAMQDSTKHLNKMPNTDFSAITELNNQKVFLKGLDTLAEINLPGVAGAGNPLPGMTKIKGIIAGKKVKTKYLNPGESLSITKVKGVKFHILGPPKERDFIFKNGKEGVDVFKKKLSLNDSSLAANSFLKMDNISLSDLPFSTEFTVRDATTLSPDDQKLSNNYNHPGSSWRKIDNDWLNSAGSLALRLNSHINNTSLAMAIEFQDSKKVLLFPGDAEYGSWESWHEIEKWKPKKETEKHFVEDLLNRTVFYKVGHHLSYNGTALQKGIMMMERNDLVAMATLDRRRISKGWKSTMPNKFLMQELIKRTQGKFFLMDEFEITNAPSKVLDPTTLDTEYETELIAGSDRPFYIQYTCDIT